MLTASVAFLLLATTPRGLQGGPQISPPFGQTTAVIKDPNNPAREITVPAHYEIQVYSLRHEARDQPTEQTVRARPEQPRAKFSITGSFTPYPPPSDGRMSAESEAVTNIYTAALGVGAPFDVGTHIQNGINHWRLAVQESANQSFEIDPMKEVKPDGWTTTHYGFESFRHTMIVALVKVAGNTRSTVSQHVFEYGTSLSPAVFRTSFLPDPKPGQPIDDPIKETGGLRLENTTPELEKHVKAVGLPTISGLTGSLAQGLSITGPKYQELIMTRLGNERIAGIMQATGYNANKLSNIIQGVHLTGDSMNQLSFSGPFDVEEFRNPCTGEFEFPPGTLFIPDRPGYQVMQNITMLRSQFDALASTDAVEIGPVSTRTHCLNMNLKEPAAGVKFFPFAPADPVATGLAKLTEASRFRGPWDQARTWIYTDKAPLAEINKRLIPGVSGGQYINGLADISRLGGFSAKDMTRADLFDANLLGNGYARPEAAAWFLEYLKTNAEPRFAAYFKNPPARLLEMLRDADRDISAQAASIIVGGLTDDNEAVRTATMGYFTRLSPEDQKRIPNLGSFCRAILYGKDSAAIGQILGMAEAKQITLPVDGLGFVSVRGPSEELKSRAKALMTR